MRRSSNAVLQTQTSEPLIVVEDSCYSEDCGGYNATASSGYPGGGGDDPLKRTDSESRHSSEDEDGSPTMNPYLLSPFAREIRKHSLPTPQCSGITASQVRRLSERGGDNSGPGPRQAEFLATLSTAPQVTAGGRRHSVVTISKVPSSLFGRNRRESVAAFPANQVGFPLRILPNRRESIACPPSTEPRGSVHNLQLDIMDDIVQARKVRMKLWTTSSEKLCEIQPLDDAGSTGAVAGSSTASGAGAQRYSNSSATSSGGSSSRRYSDFVGTTLAPIPSSSASKRRASELPPIPSSSSSSTTSAAQQSKTCNKKNSGASSTSTSSKCGIVCTNSDLVSILSLSASATEIHDQQQPTPLKTQSEEICKSNASAPTTAPNKMLDQKRTRLKSNRSNSFDVSVLHKIDSPSQLLTVDRSKENLAKAPSTWFARRHQPTSNSEDSNKKSSPSSSSCFSGAANVKTPVNQSPLQSSSAAALPDNARSPKTPVIIEKEPTKKKGRVVWDEKSGSLVDPQALGSAIEVFLRQTTPDPISASSGDNSGVIQPNLPSKINNTGSNNTNNKSNIRSSWFSSSTSGGGGSSNVKADEQQKQDGGGDSSTTEGACDSSICSTLKDLFVK